MYYACQNNNLSTPELFEPPVRSYDTTVPEPMVPSFWKTNTDIPVNDTANCAKPCGLI